MSSKPMHLHLHLHLHTEDGAQREDDPGLQAHHEM